MSSRLLDHLSAAHHGRFVGRITEKALFRSALAEADPPFYVLHIFGPGGVGKTTLLREFVHICSQTQMPATYIDARDVEPAPESFLNTLQNVFKLPAPASPIEFLAAQSHRHVLLIDTYETLAPLDRWLRRVFLPQLPDNVLIVLAGRDSLSSAWRADPGWQPLIRTLSLRNLNPEESRAYLTKREIPAEQHQAILNFTRGHPLALSLVADMFAQRRDTPGDLRPEITPNIIKSLLERLVQKVPGPAHRTALEACAIVRMTTEALLAEILAMPEPTTGNRHATHELFEWLRGLSFIESSPEGLFPHDLVRETLVTDLRWRNPDWYAELHRRARTYYTTHLQQTSGQAQQRALLDYVFLHRDNPVVRPFFEWQTSGTALPGTMRDTDLPALVAMVAEHEGADSSHLAAQWLVRQPEGVLVFRDPEGEPTGFMAMIGLHQANAQDLSIDPAVNAAWNYLQGHTPLRPGERATHFRFWMAGDTYQAVSPTQSLIFINAVRHYLTTPGLAYTFFPCADPNFWAPVFAYADLLRIPEADFGVGERQYGVYGHDWRAAPPMAWLATLAEREIAAEPQFTSPPKVTEPLVVLSKPDFELAVRDALYNISRPDALHASPLLRSRLVVERTGVNAEEPKRVAALQALLKETADSLQASPREVKLYRALYHTCFHPAPTQEQAAELLNVPFSTFRRHLKAGVTHVTELLWRQEIGGLKK